jgi:hypothetical protein
VLAWASPALADCLFQPGTITTEGVQVVRRKMRTQRRVFAASDCADEAISSAASPESGDATCLRELVELHKDAAYYHRRAHEAARTPEARAAFAAREIQARSKLHAFLKDEARSIDPEGHELRRNFADLADVYEIEQDARSYHQLISSEALRATFGPKAFEVWARALRSCSRWDFVTGRNRDMPALVRELCTADCRPELEKLEHSLPEASPEARGKAANLVPTTAQCLGP